MSKVDDYFQGTPETHQLFRLIYNVTRKNPSGEPLSRRVEIDPFRPSCDVS